MDCAKMGEDIKYKNGAPFTRREIFADVEIRVVVLFE
jgi:hypothetical protein